MSINCGIVFSPYAFEIIGGSEPSRKQDLWERYFTLYAFSGL